MSYGVRSENFIDPLPTESDRIAFLIAKINYKSSEKSLGEK
jgi:hypothetical protein